MRLDLDAYLVTPDWQPGDLNSGILCMGFDSEQLSADACLTVNAGQTDFSGTAGPLLPLDRWVHIAIDFDTQGTTTFKVGDAAPVVRPRPTNKPTGNTYAYLEIGVVGSDAPSPNIDAMFDNVVVDLP
jgi:hypothetical protein